MQKHARWPRARESTRPFLSDASSCFSKTFHKVKNRGPITALVVLLADHTYHFWQKLSALNRRMQVHTALADTRLQTAAPMRTSFQPRMPSLESRQEARRPVGRAEEPKNRWNPEKKPRQTKTLATSSILRNTTAPPVSSQRTLVCTRQTLVWWIGFR